MLGYMRTQYLRVKLAFSGEIFNLQVCINFMENFVILLLFFQTITEVFLRHVIHKAFIPTHPRVCARNLQNSSRWS